MPIAERNLRKLAELTLSKPVVIDAIPYLANGDLYLWLTDDGSNYTKHRLLLHTLNNAAVEGNVIVSWLDVPPQQIGVRNHYYLHTGDGKVGSALTYWPLGFRAVMEKTSLQHLVL